MKIIYSAALFFAIALNSFAQTNTIVYQDTVFDFIERSADGVEHVANFGGGSPVYERYVAGTNQNYSDIGMHYDYPSPRTSSGKITKVELLGFRAVIAVNQVVGTADVIPFHYYNADANGFPVGEPLASGAFTSGGLQGTRGDYTVDGGNPVEITSTDGYVIGVETFQDGNDDVLVFANNYCVVAGGPNDGRGEKRLKAKFNSSGMWENVIDFDDYSFMDCDVLIYPFLRITEDTDEASGVEDEASSVAINLFPNITSDYLNLEVENEKAKPLTLTLIDVQGKVVLTEELGQETRVSRSLDVTSLTTGHFKAVIQGAGTTVTQDILIVR